MPMPTLAESGGPEDEAGIEVGAVVAEIIPVLLEPRDANALDAGLEVDAFGSTVVLALRNADAVDAEDGEERIVACPKVRWLAASLQQELPPQHQVPEESGGHAIIRESRFAYSHQSHDEDDFKR